MDLGLDDDAWLYNELRDVNATLERRVERRTRGRGGRRGVGPRTGAAKARAAEKRGNYSPVPVVLCKRVSTSEVISTAELA